MRTNSNPGGGPREPIWCVRARVRSTSIGMWSCDRRGRPPIGQSEQRACKRWRRAFACVTQLQQLWAAAWGSLRFYQITLFPTTRHNINSMHKLGLEYPLCFDVQWGVWKRTWKDHFLEDLARITLRPVLILDRCATASSPSALSRTRSIPLVTPLLLHEIVRSVAHRRCPESRRCW